VCRARFLEETIEYQPADENKCCQRDSNSPVNPEIWRDNLIVLLPIEHLHAENALIGHDKCMVCYGADYELTATKVPGRKIRVRTAMVFMEALSRRLSTAICWDDLAMSVLILFR
jgi:hypothetical protein